MRRVLLSAFIAWHLVAILAWVTPGSPSPFRARILDVVRPYLAFTGLWQYWDMFAPKPLSLVATVEAEVTFANGHRVVWEVPGPESVRFGKFRYDRWRKWREQIRLDANEGIWPDVARFAARLHARDDRRPVRVDLVRRWSDIPPPSEDDHQPRTFAKRTHSYRFFSLDVTSMDVAP